MTRDHAAGLRPVLGRIAGNAALPKSARVAAAEGEAAPGFMDTLGLTVDTIALLEASASTAQAMADELRSVLSDVVAETNPASVPAKHHVASIRYTRKLIITEETLIPPTLMVQPPPKPNTQAIRAALEKGGTCPGAMLGNRVPTISIRARKP